MIDRIAVAAGFLVAGLTFVGFGVACIQVGAALFGAGFVLVGLIGVAGGILYAWRGGRLGVDLEENFLIIRGYFSERRIPVSSIRRAGRSVDATVIETTDGRFVIDDCELRDYRNGAELNDVINKLVLCPIVNRTRREW